MQPQTTQHDQAPAGGRAVQALLAALLLGLPAAALLFAIEIQPYHSLRDVRGAVLWDSVLLALPSALGMVLVALLVQRIGRAWSRPGLVAFLAVLAATGFGALHIVRRVNTLFLPEKTDPISLASNAGLLLGYLLLAFLLSRWLRRWQAGSWSTRTRPLFPAMLLLLLPLGALLYGRTTREEGPDVLVILIDVLGAQSLGCYGYDRPTSPEIDRFAEDAILFENAISSSTFTKTSISSLFTGRFPHHHGVYAGSHADSTNRVTSDVLSSEFTTLAEGMFASGMHTAAWVENAHIRSFTGFGQGFSLFHDQAGSMHRIMSAYLPWIEKWHARTRSFTYLHFIDLHTPYNPPESTYGTFGPTDAGLPEMDYDEWTQVRLEINNGKRPFSPEDVVAYRARHDELLSFVDKWVGYILDQLRASGRYDDTLIVLMGDHGEAFMEHGFIEHSNVPYEEVIHVPLLIKLPRSEQGGRREEQMVGLVDLGPTLLDYVGAGKTYAGESIDGSSFFDLLMDPEVQREPRAIVSEYLRNISIRTERWKYVLDFGNEPKLFDLSVDPGETEDCSARYPEVVAQLALALETTIASREALETGETVELDQDTIEDLRALGYL